MCYTDGLIEGRRTPDTAERFGIERLADTITALSARAEPEEWLDRLLAVVQEANGGRLSDDVAIVCLEASAPDTAATAAALTEVRKADATE